MSLKESLLKRTGRGGGEDRFDVVIAGGGVAALEAALGLKRLAPDHVRMSIVSPEPDFAYRPVAVAEPFVNRPSRRLPLERFARDVGATLEQDTLVSLDPERRILTTGSERELPYDAAIVAVGAGTSDASPHALTMSADGMGESLNAIVEDIRASTVQSVALVAPTPTWPLPVYELALFIRQSARQADVAVEIMIITEEAQPVAAFGDEVSAAVARILADADIDTLTGGDFELGPSTVKLEAQSLSFDRIVAAPRLVGRPIPGLPADENEFVPIDEHAGVIGVERIYAAGDLTNFPIKHGGVAAQQADAAAESIAALAGAEIEPAVIDTRVQGILWLESPLGESPDQRYLSARIEAGVPRDSRVTDDRAWLPDAKVAARYLAPYLDDVWVEPLRLVTHGR